jgi:glucose/mannose-6-phosphate isomerase
LKSSRAKESFGSLGKLISKVDRSDLKSDFDSWPELATDAWRNSKVAELNRNFQSIIFAGMGGSGIIGSLISDIGEETASKLQLHNLNDYHIPEKFSKDSLVVGVSCSGNTEETLSALAEAHSRDMSISSFGSGGKLKQLSEKWNSGFTQTRMLKAPRSSLPGLLYPVLKQLSESRLINISNEDVEESLQNLSKARDVARNADDPKNPTMSIARQIARHDPLLIYSQRRTHAVGLRFRQSINENAKLHAFNGNVPEICHNDIVAWDYDVARIKKTKSKSSGLAVLLRLDDDSKEINVRYEILIDIIRSRGGAILESLCLGKSYLSRIITMLYLLDYATFYLAILRGVDPFGTPSIDTLKSQLEKKLNLVSRLE